MAVPDFATWPLSAASAGVATAVAFVAGCMAGSFLNVVAHRVPRRQTVVFGRSHCPACGATIRARDNVPVVGWLALRGRCRDCGAAISARYPVVEAGCGCLAAWLAAGALAAADPTAALAAWVGRTAVALTLVAWGLLVERGHTVSRATVGVAAAAALVAAACVPALHPLAAWCPTASCGSTPEWPGRIVASLTGIAVGWLGGAAGGVPARSACSLVGAALGWQAAGLAALAAGGCRRLVRHDAAGPLATLAILVCWHPLARGWEAICRACAAG